MLEAQLGVTTDRDEALLPFGLVLELNVTDPELVSELKCHMDADGRPSDEYPLCALRIGLLALKQARGQLDGDTVKREGERLLAELEGKLSTHARSMDDRLTGALQDYFDPKSGRFQERLERLVQKDGELEEVMRRQIGQQDSELCKTLAAHFGVESPLMKLLSPKESEGLLRTFSETLGNALADQRGRVLTEFSLDNKDGALSRLVKTLAENHGNLGKDLQSKINDLVKEFSLDNDSSALSRMAKQLHTTSNAINDHLTLDKETSALSRLKRELHELLAGYSDTNQKFQEEVIRALNEMRVRREEAQRTPLHGKQFEQAVMEFVHEEARRCGDIATFTGDTVGLIKNCKIGDAVIELGPEHVAAGARIVVEAKDKGNYTLANARTEIEQARKNRGAEIGLFMFAKVTAPAGQDPMKRMGDDVFVIWDADDPHTDIYLQAGLTVARALCTRQAKQRDACAADFDAIDKAINDIEKKAESLDEIRGSAESIKDGADKILKRVGLARKGIEAQVSSLRELIGDLKGTVGGVHLPTA
jgi:hypothetical protein